MTNTGTVTTQHGPDHSFLAGGGEMGELMRRKDWSKSPVGAPHTWPQSLRTTLSILLHSRFPMFLFWGPELICFYNDAYRPSLGMDGKHPGILGSPGEAYWQEIWPSIKPLIDQVLGGGPATWSEDQLLPIFRNGKIEDVYWTFSYSAVVDESGKPAGVFVTCTETTDKVITHRHLQESRDQLKFAIDAVDLATWDFDAHNKTFTGNQRFRDWHGITEEQGPVPVDAFAHLSPTDRAALMVSIAQALDPATGGQLVIEYRIVQPQSNQVKILRARGRTSFDEKNRPQRLTGTIQDVTAEVLALRKIEESEKRFRNTVEQAPLGITILRGEDFIVEMVNEVYLQIIDRTESEFVGKPLFETLPEVRELVSPLLRNVIDKGEPYFGFEFPVDLHRFGKTEQTYFNFVYHPLREDSGEISGIIVVAAEVTSTVAAKHKLTESERQFRNLVMQSPIPMTILHGPNHVIEVANRVMFQDIWRKTQEEVVGRSILDVFPELRKQKYPQLLDEVFTTGNTYSEKESVAYVQGNDGMRKFYLDFEYAPLYETDNSISGIIITVNDVTEKVEARIAIEKSEKEFRQLADSLPELVWTTDADGNHTFASVRWEEFTGMSPYNEANFRAMMHPDDTDQLLATWQHCMTTGEIYKAQTRLRKKNGEYEWFYVNGEPIRNGEGKIEKWIGAFTNFNDQKKAEQQLLSALHEVEESQNKLNIVIEASELGTWELNMKTREVNYSDRYVEILGYPKKTTLTHEQILRHLHPDDLAIREAAFRTAYATGQLDYKTRIVWNDGSIHWIEGKGRVFHDEKKQPIRLVGTLRDITAEKYYEKELEERERKFRLLADSMPEFVWTGNANGELNYFNKSIYDFTGLDSTQMEGGKWIDIVHPDDQDENLKRWTAAVETGEDFLFEHRFRRHDGEFRWQLSRATPQRNEAGEIVMWVGISTDIQEMKALDQQKDFFISMASHELKTPITSIKGYVQMLQSIHNQGNDSFLKSSLRVIDKQVGTLTNLIGDLLDLSKIKSGSLILSKERFAINELILEIIDEMKHINPEYQITFSKGPDAIVLADRERIGQVLRNFLTNAIKYSPTVQSVTIDTKQEKGEVTVVVTDSGIGISKADQQKIFERFYRVEGKSEKTFPGFGIGLFISSQIIQRHEGRIGVSSEPGKGSEFYFTLQTEKRSEAD